ncbi:hypothetical protein HanRHA438_Chr01g0010211 [Helianthus annuus]|nr:hypothetical protein HanHA300_Chr01g0008081 [Helianthus annuus]KAJ0621636.1 hypothetical protein HanIR_Chr01g0010971 [Helianthus annuus]KAJ0946993.1 hypothetical protein HanRHA438_Chr01g0010211 [Helianthus annuus]
MSSFVCMKLEVYIVYFLCLCFTRRVPTHILCILKLTVVHPMFVNVNRSPIRQ